MLKNLESYYQEAGRAGRDGEPADCILMFSNGDVQTAKFLIQNSDENQELTDDERGIILSRDMERLNKMVGYCKTGGCLRAYILAYFGETHGGSCGNCGSCKSEYMQADITTEVQKILSCVARVEKKYAYGIGVTLYVRMLHGSKEQRVKELGLDKLPTYGIMGDVDRPKIREYIDYLVSMGYLQITAGAYPVLRLTEKSGDVLFRNETMTMPVKKLLTAAVAADQKHRSGKASEHTIPTEIEIPEEDLLSALKALRTRLAQEAGVPAYIIFSNAALNDMAAKRPRTMPEFLDVSGVGEIKAGRYGEVFLKAIAEYMQ